ncbi:MAG: hypothetical protein ACI9TY_001342 [Alphaproteobacteria bacterium]|jgi:hypothetical protein
MDKFRSKIEQVRAAVIDIKNQREASVYDKDTLPKIPPFPTYTLTPEVSDIFKDARAVTYKELNVYNPVGGDDHDETLQQPDNSTTVDHSYIDSFKNNLIFFSLYDFPEASLGHYDVINMTAPELNLYKVVSAELGFAYENMARLGYSIATLQKIKTAVSSIGLKRVKDAITMLKNAKESDPNNRSIAFILSQILYFRVQNGSSESLPEARSEAKRSCLYSENCDEHQLRQYRYIYVLQECNHSPKKAVNLMREFYLLNPESMTEGNGIGAHEGVHLKTWILLSTLSPELFTSFEIDSLFTITSMAPGGVCFYLNVMRSTVLQRLGNDNDVSIRKLMKIEEMLYMSHENYTSIISTIEQNYDGEGNLTPASKFIWTIEQRYTSLLLKAANIPKFDEIYLYTSLDAKRCSTEAYPNRAMAAQGLANVNYWQVWSIAITSAEGKGSSRTLPVKRMALHTEVFSKFDSMLTDLEVLEKELIPQEKWDIIKKYMPNYEYEVFPHVAAGADAFKSPTNPYYLNFYRAWVKDRPKGLLPSGIIRTYAERGHFIDAEEVVAAFEGISRVIVDEVHGLKSRAKEALVLCLKDTKSDQSEKAKDLLRQSHFNDYWWLYIIVIPLAALSFYVMSSSDDSGGSMITLLVIILFAGGLGFGLYSLAKSSDVDEGDDPTKDVENDKGL